MQEAYQCQLSADANCCLSFTTQQLIQSQQKQQKNARKLMFQG
jgi:hypothetical protein